ncbi:hypothetical protein PIB30_071846 [Stylosanthes scabra]|uniref:Rapid ALkalinization Factor n=1 Tax=Stylosanthes scabra TaxID=79078 RepID=A0ABU6TPS2_9FABA|nr:hypothetical protein [Stylosanthes scabra]
MRMMMKLFFWSQVLLIALVLVMTVASAANNEGNSSSEKNTTTTSGCIGLHCLVSDDAEEDEMWMDQQHQQRRMLATMGHYVAGKTPNPGQSSISCPSGGQPYTTCNSGGVGGPCHTDEYLRHKLNAPCK